MDERSRAWPENSGSFPFRSPTRTVVVALVAILMAFAGVVLAALEH